jgi:hypothetical protein
MNNKGNAIAIMISAKAKAIVNIIIRPPDPTTNFTLNGGNLRQGLVEIAEASWL